MDEFALDAQQKMNKTVESLRQNLSTLRTGRASPAILAGVQFDYYGSMTPISQVSSITSPEPRLSCVNAGMINLITVPSLIGFKPRFAALIAETIGFTSFLS